MALTKTRHGLTDLHIQIYEVLWKHHVTGFIMVILSDKEAEPPGD